MAEYINKQAFNDAIREAIRKYPNTFYNGLETARRIAHDMNAADVVTWEELQKTWKIANHDVAPVRHGRWIWDEDGMDWNIGAWRCSECKAMAPMWWNTDKTSPVCKSGHRYCPNCGAKMDGGTQSCPDT